MALPALKDLLPDHLFHHPSTVRQPPPTKSILLHVPSSVPSHPEDPAVAPYPYRCTPPPPQLPPPLPFQSTIQSPFTPEPCRSKHSYDTRQGSIYEHAPLSQPHHDRSSAGDRFYGINMHPTKLDKDVIDKEAGDEGGKRKHPCPMCGKRFNRPSSLRIHLNTHTGAKPYVCPFAGCLRSFNVSSNMRRHFRNHARRAPPPLPIAAAEFIMQPDMRGEVQGRCSVEPSNQFPGVEGVAESTSRLKTERLEWFGKAVDCQSELNNAIAIRGAEAAARAMLRVSVSSATSGMGLSSKQGHNACTYDRSVSRVASPYPPSDDNPPPLTQAHPESIPPRLLSPTALGMAHGYSYASEYPSEYIMASDDLSDERQISASEADKRGAAYHFARPARGSGSAGASISVATAYRGARILDKPEEEYPARFDHPPTPPYTNEAAQSPPSHPPALALSSAPATVLNLTSRYACTDDPRSSGLEPRASPEGNIFEVGRECHDAAGTEHATSHVRLIPEESLCPPGHGTTEVLEFASSYMPGRLEPGGRYRFEEEERDRYSPARYDERPRYALQYVEPHASPRSLSCVVGHRDEQEAGQARETRMRVRQQQPSPDTPSLHVVALHVDSTDECRARSTSPSISCRNSVEKGEGETHSRGRHGVSSSRSSFSLDAILHPYPSEMKAADGISTSVRTPTEPHAQTQALQNEIETVGQMRTPGAAPPPPYPLYTHPPPLAADTRHEGAGDEGCEGSRSSKRRRRA